MMTREEKIRVAQKIAMINQIYSFKITDDAAMYQAELLADLPYVLVIAAFDDLVKNNTTGRPPSIGHVRQKLEPKTDDRALSIDLSRKVLKALNKHGWSWEHGYYHNGKPYFEDDKGNKFETFREAVVSELGELGWEIIESRGGWQNLSTMANEQEEGIYQAQLRDQIEATIKNKKAGVDVSKIPLPSPDTEAVKALIAGVNLKTV